MRLKTWFGGTLVLSAALSLALAGSVFAQSQERGSGSYGSSQGTGSGYQKDKKLTPPAKCDSEGPVGVCAPKSASKQPKPPTSRSPESETK